MDIALELKFTQHPELRDELLATGDAELGEVMIQTSKLRGVTDITPRIPTKMHFGE